MKPMRISSLLNSPTIGDEQISKAGDEKRTPVVVPNSKYLDWFGANQSDAVDLIASMADLKEVQLVASS